MPKYLVTGADGQLGTDLTGILGESAFGATRRHCDFTEPTAVADLVTRLNPRIVINCAAYTSVDQAEEEPAISRQVNQDAVAAIVAACRHCGSKFVQISTDYIFDTNTDTIPLKETATANPAGVYAKTKLAGENAALQDPANVVIRTCGLFGNAPGRRNFVRTMLRLASEREVVRVVDDQTCCPSFTGHVARAVVFLAEQDVSGIFHVANTGATTWCGFAREIFRQANLKTWVEPITTEQFGAAAPRPRYSVLDTTKYHATGGPRMPTIEEGLTAFLRAEPADH